MDSATLFDKERIEELRATLFDDERIEKLRGKANYTLWSRITRDHLRREDLWRFLDPKSDDIAPPLLRPEETTDAFAARQEEWKARTLDAAIIIMGTCTEEVQRTLSKDCTNPAHYLWIQLQTKYGETSDATRWHLFQRWARLRYAPDSYPDGVSTFTSEYLEVAVEAQEHGMTLDDVLLFGLLHRLETHFPIWAGRVRCMLSDRPARLSMPRLGAVIFAVIAADNERIWSVPINEAEQREWDDDAAAAAAAGRGWRDAAADDDDDDPAWRASAVDNPAYTPDADELRARRAADTDDRAWRATAADDRDWRAGAAYDRTWRPTSAERAEAAASTANDRTTSSCSYCHRLGHVEDTCWELHPQLKPDRGRNNTLASRDSDSGDNRPLWSSPASWRRRGPTPADG